MTSKNGLKVIALISGGKDSLFSILHCLANGHEIVALGNLYPDDVKLDQNGHQIENEQDTDSYMYQTVGHSVVSHYADALDLPLYRRSLAGRVVDHSLNYSPSGVFGDRKDEAEDLALLLQDILAKHPDANAVSTGAILSTYQRVRVESVAIRLNLVPLSYLWQYPYLSPHQDSSLLQDMRNVNMDSRMIKVASGGLDDSFLNQIVSDTRTIRRMTQKMKLFEPAVGAILGEGGEFETLAVSGPRPIWKKKIVLDETLVNAGDGGSFSLAIRSSRTESFDLDDQQVDVSFLRVPPLLDSEFHDLIMLEDSLSTIFSTRKQSLPCDSPIFPQCSSEISLADSRSNRHGSSAKLHSFRGHGISAANQMRDIARMIRADVASSIISTTLLLRDMADFQGVNQIYGKLFTEALPPSRVTVSVGDLLPEDCFVVLSVKTSSTSKSDRSGLHVQSRSYWAPANIGPYSQAIVEPMVLTKLEETSSRSFLVNVAGQIPLVPATTELINDQGLENLIHAKPQSDQTSGDLLSNASVALSLQHLWRIGRVTSVKAWTGGIAYINIKAASQDYLMSQAFSQWKAVHDYWTQRQLEITANSGNMLDSQADTRPLLPNIGCFGDSSSFEVPPCFTILVADLPRGAPIEWWSIGISSRKLRHETSKLGTFTAFHTHCLLSKTTISWVGIEFDDDMEALIQFIQSCVNESLVTIFAAKALPGRLSRLNHQLIPSFGIHNWKGEDLDAVIIVTAYDETN